MTTVIIMIAWFFIVVGIGDTVNFLLDLLGEKSAKAKAEKIKKDREVQITGYNIIKARIELDMVMEEVHRVERETNALAQVLKREGENGQEIYVGVFGATEKELGEIKAYVSSIKD